MSGSCTGAITQWNDATGQGLVTEDGDGVHVVSASDCSSTLLNALRGKAIPPGDPVRVTFDLDVTNHAINVDLAESIALAASAELKTAAALKGSGKSRPGKTVDKQVGSSLGAIRVWAGLSPKQMKTNGSSITRSLVFSYTVTGETNPFTDSR